MTRNGACKAPYPAYKYALEIDKCRREDTRKAVCENPESAYWYAKNIDKRPRKDTRDAACKDPEYAYKYAYDIDKCPHNKTRDACGNDPILLMPYIVFIENALPNHFSRKKVCAMFPQFINIFFWYVKNIDKCFHLETWKTIQNTEYVSEYNDTILHAIKNKII
jgi:hypothetical protein